MKTKRADAQRLAEKTADAYSCDRYASWTAVCGGLLAAGYTEQQAEAILRSKWTRWAADASQDSGKRYGRATAMDLLSWMSKMSDLKQQVEALTKETFS